MDRETPVQKFPLCMKSNPSRSAPLCVNPQLNTQPKLSVILPCAGEGRRLGASGPKELHEAEPGIPLIQYSLDLLMQTPPELAAKTQVVVVIRSGKESVVSRVIEQLEGTVMRVVAVSFDPELHEWPGSIHSAREHFSESNVVLLPDSFLVLSSLDRSAWLRRGVRVTLLEGMIEALSYHSLVFGVKRSHDEAELRQFGALMLDEDARVSGLQDKPTDVRAFNAIWCCLGFQRSIAGELHPMLMQSLTSGLHENMCGQSACFPAGSIDVQEYFDLGTPERIERFLEYRSATA